MESVMDFMHLGASQRILYWRDFRISIKDLPEVDQLQKIAEFWSKAPLITYSIDWDRPDTWPSAWELIHEGNFDNSAIGYLMEQTLIMLDWSPDRLLLTYIRDKNNQDQMMILIVDDKYVLNYSWGEVFNIDAIRNNCVSMIKYKWNDNIHQVV